jgi:type IV secretion system protein VirB4
MDGRAIAIRREFSAADRIPYTAHVAPTVLRTAFGDYLQVFRLGGASFESNDDEELNNWHERLNVLWRNIGTPNVALWTQVVRRRVGMALISKDSSLRLASHSFADDLHARYEGRLADETLMTNEVYLAVVHRPAPGTGAGLASRLLRKHSAMRSQRLALADALDACQKLSQTLAASLARYEPDVLGTYQWRGSLVLIAAGIPWTIDQR